MKASWLRAIAAVSIGAGVLVGPAAGAATPGEPCATTQPAYRYVVLFQPGEAAGAVEREVAGKCGRLEHYYGAIGVAVASSEDASFDARFGGDRAFSGQKARAGLPAAKSPFDGMTARVTASNATEDLSAQQWDMRAIRATEANKVHLGSRDVVVGVLDTGVDADHPDLVRAVDRGLSVGCDTGTPVRGEQAWAPKYFHGTGVAGAIAAAHDGKGISGVAPGVRLAAVQLLRDDGWIYPEAAVCAFTWAAEKRFTLTNGSLNIGPWGFLCADRPGEKVGYEAIVRAVRYATGHGVLHVASAGNWKTDLHHPTADPLRPPGETVDERCDMLPNQLPDVVTVSAVGFQKRLTSYSDYGLGIIQVTAPGGDEPQTPPSGEGPARPLTTLPGGKYGSMGGTSAAAPRATGVLALLASRYPGLTPRALKALLPSLAANPLACPPGAPACTGTPRHNSYYGYGMVDALGAVRSKAAAAGRPEVIFDSDMDFDDASALAYLVQQHRQSLVTLRAVTVTNNGAGLPGKGLGAGAHPENRHRSAGHPHSDVTSMGGAVRVPGNLCCGTPPHFDGSQELNMWADPPAAGKVIGGSRRPVHLVPLDATNDVPITRAFIDRLADQRHTPAAGRTVLSSTGRLTWFGNGADRAGFERDFLASLNKELY